VPRRFLVTLHRWFGLAAAAFLFLSGATGAVIAWDHELDGWLNPRFFDARTPGAPLPALELARRVEAADPRVRVSYLPLEIEPGDALVAYVEPRFNPASGQPFEVDYNQVAIDPVTGAIQGRREWGAFSLARLDLLPFLYKLHYSLHLSAAGGYETGILLMGVIAVAWVVDTLIALWVSFPSRAAWRRSFAFRLRSGGHKLAFDLHRSGGAWLFVLVLVIAVTSVSMNLERQVMRPIVSLFSPLAPSRGPERAAVAGPRRPAACTSRPHPASTVSASSTPIMRTATVASATRGSISTHARARSSPPRRPAKGVPETSSCSRCFRCTRAESSACRAACSYPSWASRSRASRSPAS
jgi:uncharacterized iron-regulated membrane protein